MSSKDFENKLEAIKKLIENIDLSKCEPTPWSTDASNHTDYCGEVIGYTHLVNGKGEIFLSTDRESDHEVQVGDWFHLGDFYIAAQAVNAIDEIQNILGVKGEIKNKIEFDDAERIQSNYNRITNSVSKVCEIIKRFSYRKELPRIPASSFWCFKHGNVYPDHGWALFPKTGAEEARIMIPAWDGYDGENFDNSSVVIPFDFINMEEEELIELLKGETNEQI